MERWCETNAIGSLHGRCRVHRAEILRLRGSCHEAESQALMACEELRPHLRRELGWPLNELGRIRLTRQTSRARRKPCWPLIAPGGIPNRVSRWCVWPKETRPPRLPRYGTPSSIPCGCRPRSDHRTPTCNARRCWRRRSRSRSPPATSAGPDRPPTSWSSSPTRFESKALVAGAALARGRVRLADGDAAGAEQSLSEAVRLWNEVGAPYEAALARLGLADAHAASGSEHRAVLERQAARTILDGIQAAPSTPAGTSSTTTHSTSNRLASANVFRREGDYWSVIFDGHTVHVRDLKGMRYLARLLADPGREYHVLDLVAAETGRGAQVDSGQAADLPARRSATRARSSTREPRTPTADASPRSTTTSSKPAPSATTERAAQADAERGFLVRELARAFGLSGRGRRAASASERARAGVTRAVRQAISPHRRAPSPARRAPQPYHPHRHLLRLPTRPSRTRRVDVLTDAAGLTRTVTTTSVTSAPPSGSCRTWL